MPLVTKDMCVYLVSCSLGISLLELACDVELPSGGDKWHLLRSGHLPIDLMEGVYIRCS